MSATELTTQIHRLASAMKEAGLDVRIWKEQRIYINNLGRDITAYVEMDEPWSEESQALWSGCSMKVFTDCEQSGAWRLNRRKQVKHGLMTAIYGAGIVDVAPCESWEEVIL